MTTKVNKLSRQSRRFSVKPTEFNINNSPGKSLDTTTLDPKLKLDEHDAYVFKLIYDKLNNSKTAAEIHLREMQRHQDELERFLFKRSESLGIKFSNKLSESDYVFNATLHTFIPKSFPVSKGGTVPDPDSAKESNKK